MNITLVGLGTDVNDISLSGKLALDRADKIIARSERMCAFEALNGYNVETLDGVYNSSRNFDTLNKNLASAVLKAARESDVVYCVDGAVSEDESCKIILAKAKNVIVCEGVSKSAKARTLAKIKGGQVVSISAYDVENLKSCPAAVVYDIDDSRAAEMVKARLSDLYGEESDCAYISGSSVKTIKIYEIDRQNNYGGFCAVAVEEADFLHKARYDYADLEHLIKLLRAPGGCPWDRVQTNDSIKSDMIEEAYELVDAINRDDDEAICEEAGDVLLQAAFHAVIKEEQGAFNGTDVLTGVIKKLIFRHSHVFGGDSAADANSALNVWDKNKNVEKEYKNFGETLLAVPNNFPACMRAQKIQKRASKAGMDFLSSLSASEKLSEEVGELLTALIEGDTEHVREEGGDVLFSAVNVCRLAGIDCEEALAESCEKFVKRFVMCEQIVLSEGKKMTDLNELELDWYWLQAKNALKQN